MQRNYRTCRNEDKIAELNSEILLRQDMFESGLDQIAIGLEKLANSQERLVTIQERQEKILIKIMEVLADESLMN
jgi:hypothetical protein